MDAKKYRIAQFAVVAVILGAFIFFSETRPIAGLRDWSIQFFAPLVSAGDAIRKMLGGTEYISREEAEALRRAHEEYKVRLFELETLRSENARLRAAVGLKAGISMKLESAEVLHYFKESGSEFFTINKGSDAGLRDGFFVVDARGALVGVLQETRSGFSRVGIASNTGMKFAAEMLPIPNRVLAHGIGGRAFSIDLVQSTAPVRQGDFIALQHASGSRKILIGEVVRVEPQGGNSLQKVSATLIARPESLDEVFILIPPE